MRVQYLYWRNSHILVTQQPPSKFMYGYMPHPRRFKAVPFKAHGKTYTRFSGLEYFYQIFISGSFLREIGICPWDYSAARFQYRGIIRLDYAPLWFAAGLIFEKILTKSA